MIEYKAVLSSGGTLRIHYNSWSIYYYSPHYDGRKKAKEIYISGYEIDKYIAAWKNNFEKYLSMKNILSRDGEYIETGECWMKIKVGKYGNGVFLFGNPNYRFDIIVQKQEDLDAIIAEYEFCKSHANNIISMLTRIESDITKINQ